MIYIQLYVHFDNININTDLKNFLCTSYSSQNDNFVLPFLFLQDPNEVAIELILMLRLKVI